MHDQHAKSARPVWKSKRVEEKRAANTSVPSSQQNAPFRPPPHTQPRPGFNPNTGTHVSSDYHASKPQHTSRAWPSSNAVQGQKQRLSSKTSLSPPVVKAKSSGPGENGSLVPIELISSPSRGIDSSSPATDLTQASTQDRFRKHISDRIQSHATRFERIGAGNPVSANDIHTVPIPAPLAPSDDSKSARNVISMNLDTLHSLQEILLLVRRLREGCVASKREDWFALDVYKLSVMLSLLAGDAVQLSASLGRFVELCATVDVGINNARSEEEICSLVVWPVPTLDWPSAASLLLIWISITAGHIDRIGGHQSTSRSNGSLAWYQQKQQLCASRLAHTLKARKEMSLAEQAHIAIARNNILMLRCVLLNSERYLWHRILLCRIVEQKRSLVWDTMRKAYVHLAIDRVLLSDKNPDDESAVENETLREDWLEKMLLVDVELLPPSPSEMARTSPSIASPHVKATLEGLNAVRAHRLEALFDAFKLPQTSGQAHGLSRWHDRLGRQAGKTVIKVR